MAPGRCRARLPPRFRFRCRPRTLLVVFTTLLVVCLLPQTTKQRRLRAGSGGECKTKGKTKGKGKNKPKIEIKGAPERGGGIRDISEKMADLALDNAPHRNVRTIANLANDFGLLDGAMSSALFAEPRALAISPNGELHIADRENNRIRKLTTDGQIVTVAGTGVDGMYGYVDGDASQAMFWFPVGLSFDRFGNLFVCDSWNHRIRRISTSLEVTTYAGSGILTQPLDDLDQIPHRGRWDGSSSRAKFCMPHGLAVDKRTGDVFVTDSDNNVVRKISTDGQVTTLAGRADHVDDTDGKGSVATFWNPEGIVVDSKGTVFVTDAGCSQIPTKHKIRKITPDGEVTSFAGSSRTPGSRDGLGTQAKFWGVRCMSVDKEDNIYLTEMLNHRVRKVAPNAEVTTIAGDGKWGDRDGYPDTCRFTNPYGIAVDPHQRFCYVSEDQKNRLRIIEPRLKRETPGGIHVEETMEAMRRGSANLTFAFSLEDFKRMAKEHSGRGGRLSVRGSSSMQR